MICTKLSKICGSREDVENEKKSLQHFSYVYILQCKINIFNWPSTNRWVLRLVKRYVFCLYLMIISYKINTTGKIVILNNLSDTKLSQHW